MPAYAYFILLAAWLLWLIPFIRSQSRGTVRTQTVDRRARLGMILQAVAYALLWQGKFWTHSVPLWRVSLALALYVAAIAFSWTATPALGRQWRFDAGLNADHQLVRSGPYRFVRHPIYASMLCMFAGTGALITPPLLLLPAAVLFIIGMEIRVRIEDRLLASRFGQEFADYSRSTPAYLPFVR
jgi:protein-S-isoprenylcysteine O-methyltransferase Ste14